MKHFRKETLGTFGLVIVALFWGLGFPALKVVSESIPTFYLIGLRFLIAAVLLSMIFHKRLKKINKALIRSAFILSVFLFLTYGFATLGIKYTSSAKASFFCCLGVLVIPVILRLVYKEKISSRVAVCIMVCTAGLFLISYTKGMGLNLSSGDLICLGCSVTGAIHVVMIGRVAKDQDPALLATAQLFFISVWAFSTALLLEDAPDSISLTDWGVMVFLAVFCTAAAFVLQCACQRYISPARAGVIFSIEPVSGALFSAVLLGDRLGINGIIGGALIVASMIYMESKESKIICSGADADVSLSQTYVSPNQISENIPSQESPELCDTSRMP